MPSAMSPAGVSLFGNAGVKMDAADQGATETEEERRKRLQQLQAAQQKISGNLSAGFGAALSMSPAGSALGF
jgi:hypothetical protein